MMPLYLASQSPRRAQLLTQMGLDFEALPPDPHEDAEALEATRPGELPLAYVQRVTAAKLDAACARLQRRARPDGVVLCADTTVALGRRILGKPADMAQARTLLQALSGRTHRVMTAVALAHGARRAAVVSVSRVRVAPLTPAQIDAYVASGEPMGKAGAYAIQGRFACHVETIVGSHSGIMGLPVFDTAQLLRAWGWSL